MAHYAKVENGIVTEVIVAEEEFIYSGAVGDPSMWIRTSYNGNIRKNYAAIGYEYNTELDAFISPKPYESWILDADLGAWKPPVDKPEGYFIWNEEQRAWVESPSPLSVGV
jgi:hypothetical protein